MPAYFLECIGGGVAFPLFPEGSEEAGGKDSPGAWQGGESGEVGMALGALGDGLVEVFDRLQGDAELADESLDQERMGGDDALIGGQRCRALDGLDALVDDGGIAHVMVSQEAFQGGAARQLGGLEGGPWGEEVTEERGVYVVKPVQDVREVVFQGTGEAVGEAHVIADQTEAVFDELRKGTHRGDLGGEGWEFVAMLEQAFDELTDLGGGRVDGLSADIMFGIGPIKAHEGRNFFLW
jgi:hypothetical protein